jgi:hypothetical protein
VIVPEPAWTSAVEWSLAKTTSWAKLPFPTGSPENKRARRQQERERTIGIWDDRWKFSGLVGAIDWRSCAGSYVALPKNETKQAVALEVIP